MIFLIGFFAFIVVGWIVVLSIEKSNKKKALEEIGKAADPNHELHEYWKKIKDWPDEEKIKMWHRIEYLYFMEKEGRH